MFTSFFVLASLFARLAPSLGRTAGFPRIAPPALALPPGRPAPLAKMKKAAARFLFEVSSGGFEGLLS
jgi:hypothetical protein